MLETVAKNLWLLLTLVVPGLFTYGAWRLLLLLEPSSQLDTKALAQIDDSGIATTSIIIALALLQQSVAITIEFLLWQSARMLEKRWPSYYALFYGRFALAAAGKLTESATRIVGNFFLSINMCIGLSLLLLYFMAYEKMDMSQWVPVSIVVLLVPALVTTIFRMFNAMKAVEACQKS